MQKTQDTGTFRATTPERGGFLNPDGTPVKSSNPFAELPHQAAELPVDEEERKPRSVAFALRMLLIFAIATTAVVLLVYWLISYYHSPSLGQLDGYSELFPEL